MVSHHRGPEPAPGDSDTDRRPVLSVDGLRVEFRTSQGTVYAVRGISFDLDAGETLAILGESGCGKTVTAEVIAGILKSPPGRVVAGEVRFRGRDVTSMSAKEGQALRGDKIAIVFQNALEALNPVFTVGWQIAEVFRVHRGSSRKQGMAEAVSLLRKVGIPDPERRSREYVHQFSGGMRQRAMIAMAIALKPQILIADEPTTALDVTVQAQILHLLRGLRNDFGMAMIFVTHDVAVAAEIADRVAVMYAGEIVEIGTADQVLTAPQHPYTKALLRSSPTTQFDKDIRTEITGAPPDLSWIGPGCAFAPRCVKAGEGCSSSHPELRVLPSGQACACLLVADEGKRR